MRRRIVVSVVALSFGLLPAWSGSSASASTHDAVAPAAKKIVGTLKIPRLGINVPIRVGTTNAVFDAGVGQFPGTAEPGTTGNLVIGGHRTSGRKPFARIETMRIGDPILVTSGGSTYTYRVTRTFVVKANAFWITYPTDDAVVTLFACHPRGSTSHRYIVRGVLQG